MTDRETLPSWELRPIEQPDGRWSVADENGYGGTYGSSFATRDEAEIWIDGYNQGAAENM